jgi:hypothetical protein
MSAAAGITLVVPAVFLSFQSDVRGGCIYVISIIIGIFAYSCGSASHLHGSSKNGHFGSIHVQITPLLPRIVLTFSALKTIIYNIVLISLQAVGSLRISNQKGLNDHDCGQKDIRPGAQENQFCCGIQKASLALHHADSGTAVLHHFQVYSHGIPAHRF